MYAAKVLPIAGHRELPVPNTFFRQGEETDHLAVIFPGRGYTCDMPLLYYTSSLLLGRAADVLLVEYNYNRRMEFDVLPEAAQDRWFQADVAAALAAGIDQRPYRQVTLVGKSLGTRAMGHLLTTDPRLATARAVWLTPLLRDARLRAQITACEQPSLFVLGSADPHYDPALVAEVETATGGQMMVVRDANHSLEIDGDLWQSLAVLEDILRATRMFLMR
jgi:pimeloyl-ACP methyl ester carboxylesterase